MPVGHPLRWVRDHLAADRPPLTVEAINAHISAESLRDVLPAETAMAPFADAIAERGGVDFEQFTFTPRPEAALAIVRTGTGEKAALVPRSTTRASPHRGVAPDEAPAEPLATSGAYAGLFELSGRQLFLSCIAQGEPVSVLYLGLGGTDEAQEITELAWQQVPDHGAGVPSHDAKAVSPCSGLSDSGRTVRSATNSTCAVSGPGTPPWRKRPISGRGARRCPYPPGLRLADDRRRVGTST